MYLNDEEISKMYEKLYILSLCVEIKEMGYEYDDEDTVVLDIQGCTDGYYNTNYSFSNMTERILKPFLYNGWVHCNSDIVDMLTSEEIEIPMETYMFSDDNEEGAGEISGMTVYIDNDLTEKLIKYGIYCTDEFKYKIRKSSFDMEFYDSTIDTVQFLFDGQGIGVVVPSDWFYMEEFISDFVSLIHVLRDTVSEYEHRMELKVA